MAQLKAGTRLKSTVCDTQLMVIAAPAGELALSCGGAPLADMTAQVSKGALHPDLKDGTQIGKRSRERGAEHSLGFTCPASASWSPQGESP